MKNYDEIEISKQRLIAEDLDLIETNRDLMTEVKRLKKVRNENLERRRFIAKQIKAHDFELYN